MNQFSKYIGVDYSGAQTPTSSLSGLRVYQADGKSGPVEVLPPPSPKKYWTRKGLAVWLNLQVAGPHPTIVGIDHAFSFPTNYFERYLLHPNWDYFLNDFCAHWPTDHDHMYVDFIRDGHEGRGALRGGNTRWKRMTETRSGSAKSVFHFGVQGEVAKSTHSGIPWLKHLRYQRGSSVHFWPFDGWTIPPGKHAVVEVYPRLWKGSYPAAERNGDQQDAYTVCRWMMEADASGELQRCLDPDLSDADRLTAGYEGWILGVR